jgi:hypothetical protein
LYSASIELVCSQQVFLPPNSYNFDFLNDFASVM